ncbi:MAG: hypothetical protein M3R22_11155 [Pseudomonadota bacterium]|nr:hypothetical protein [Pseudomonadota bacterium]
MANDLAQDALPAGMSANAFSSLFQAINGLRNRRALIALIGCTVLGVLVAGLLVAMSGTLGFIATALALIVYLVAVGTGVNAAGVLHMDRARGISPRSTADALVYGLMCIPKLIVLGLALVAVEIVVFIVLAIAFFICKIPVLGPLLLTVVFPISVVIAGLTVCGLFLCMVLSLPAIWQGASITRALAQTLAIARSRLIEALLLLVFVWFLALAVGLVVFGVLFAGLMPTLGMSASILGFGMGGMGSLMGAMQGYGGGGQMIAGAIGSLVLWAIAASLVGQVYLLGLCLVYLRVTEGLDLTASEAALRQKIDEARRRTTEFGEKARHAASRDGAAAASAAATGAAVAAYPTAPSPSPAAPPASAVPPAYTPPSAPPYNPPPAYNPAPAFAAPPFNPAPVHNPPPAYSPPHDFLAPSPHDLTNPDIALPFDDAVAPPPGHPPAPPPYAAPPVYVPPPPQPPIAAAPPPAPTTTCPQCLSAVTGDDLFCGVCGYRLK